MAEHEHVRGGHDFDLVRMLLRDSGELFIQRTRMRTLFALSASIAAMAALMAASFMPLHLSSHISNKMPVLHDVWL